MWLVASAAAQTLVIDGEVPAEGLDHLFVPFEVPQGIAEIEVRHDDLSSENILDWGLYDPAGHRGWGGGNTEPIVVNAEAASRSYTPGPITPGTWQVVIGKASIPAPPAQYHLEIDLRPEPTLAPQTERTPYVPSPPLAVGARWYAGDLHVHSRESGDAVATLDEIADLAAAQGLDFVVITDHNTVSQLDYLVDAQSRHPDVLLIPGTEYTTYSGHANAFGVREWVDHKLGQPGVTLEAAAAAYAAQGALLSVNHPVLRISCIGCAWELGFDGFAGIEIGTGGWDPIGNAMTPDVIALWDELSDEGRHVAAVGGSDDHRAGQDLGPFNSPIGSPTTMVWADELSEAAILAGIAAERTVVKLQDSGDPMVDLTASGMTVSATVTGGDGLSLVFVADGVVADSVPIAGDPFTASWDAPDDVARVRAEVRELATPRAVSSHVWPEPQIVTEDPPSDCGCGSAPGGPVAALLVVLYARRRRG